MRMDETTLTRTDTVIEQTVDASTVKTILVHIQNDETAKQRIAAAMSIARATSAHVTCLQVTPIEAYVAFEGFGGLFIMNDVIKSIDEDAARLRERVESELAGEDVSWDYIKLTGNVAMEIVSHAALADLVVAGREPPNEFGSPAITLLGDLLERLRTPLFLPGTARVDPTGPAIVAWDGSYEAANAVRSSIGLLKLASSVRVLHLTASPEAIGTFPGTRLVDYLSRQGIHAELIVETLPGAGNDQFVAAGLISRARSLGDAYVVMGGYGRSRVREFLFGGVTRTMLSDSSVPVVIAR
jgi:nucleotide-binding universal stress UspA family protein